MRRRPQRPGIWVRLVALVLKPLLYTFTRRDWRGQEHLPATGGVIVVANHNSLADPAVVAQFLYDSGRVPRFLAKASLFDIPVAGRVIRGAGQIPVYRQSRDAALAYTAAVDAVRRGECVVVYPEGTTTRDPDLWPMVGKTGAARIALATGAPVLPLSHWGAHEVLPRRGWPRLLPPRTVQVELGIPVDLSDIAPGDPGGDVLREVTARFRSAVTALLERQRGQAAPARVYDPRAEEAAADGGDGPAAGSP